MSNDDDPVLSTTKTVACTQPDWKNPPSLADLKQDHESAQVAHQVHVDEVDAWLRVLDGEQTINAKRGRSKLVPRLARRQAEWRYAALSEPFLSTDDLFNTSPQTFEDKESAVKNGLLLNYQLNCRMERKLGPGVAGALLNGSGQLLRRRYQRGLAGLHRLDHSTQTSPASFGTLLLGIRVQT